MVTQWSWTSESISLFWKSLRVLRKQLGQEVELRLSPGGLRLLVMVRSGKAFLDFSVGYEQSETVVFRLPLKPLLAASRGLLTAVLDWMLEEDGDRWVLHLGGSAGKSVQVPVLGFDRYFEQLLSDSHAPQHPCVEISAKSWLQETSAVITGFRPLDQPAVEGILQELELRDEAGVAHRTAIPDREITSAYLRVASFQESHLRFVRIPVRWIRVGGLDPYRQMQAESIKIFAPLLRVIVGRKDQPMIFSWEGTCFGLELSVPGLRARVEIRYLTSLYIKNYEQLLVDSTNSLALSVRDWKNRLGVLSSSHAVTSAPKVQENRYADSVLLSDGGGRVSMQSGAFLDPALGRQAVDLLDSKTVPEMEHCSLVLSRRWESVQSRDLDIAPVLQEAGTGTEILVEERDRSVRFGKLLLPLGTAKRLSTWSSKRCLGFGVSVPGTRSDGTPLTPRVVFRESESSLPEGKSGKKRRVSRRLVDRVSVIATEVLHPIMEEES